MNLIKFIGRMFQLLGLCMVMDAMTETIFSELQGIAWYSVISTWIIALGGGVLFSLGAFLEFKDVKD